MIKDKVTIHTDGSCHGNQGAGGYAAAITHQDGFFEIRRGGDYYTTNNRMEVMAVIEGLQALQKPSEVTIITDSKYVADQINRKNLREYVNTPNRVNADLWQKVLQLMAIHKVNAQWVKGHAGDKINNMCDKVANDEANMIEEETEYRLKIFSEMLMCDTVSAEVLALKHNSNRVGD